MKNYTQIPGLLLAMMLFFPLGCKKQGVSVTFELTSSEIEERKDSLILVNVDRFLRTNQSAVVKNYHFLCDSSMIKPLRDYDVQHKRENIIIGLSNKDVRLTPVPQSYKITDGPKAEYRIENDRLGKLFTYFVDLKLDDTFEIVGYKATLRFTKVSNGMEKLSFEKEILADENYLIEEQLIKK